MSESFQELAAQLPPGPWHWHGQPNSVYLATKHSGWWTLMGTARAGFSGAQFTFQHGGVWDAEKRWWTGARVQKGKDGLYRPRAPHALDEIRGINAPLAKLIERIPEMIAEIEQLRAEVERLKWVLHEVRVSYEP